MPNQRLMQRLSLTCLHATRCQCIARRQGQVAQPAGMADAADCAAFGAAQKFGFTPGHQLSDAGRGQALTGLPVGQRAAKAG